MSATFSSRARAALQRRLLAWFRSHRRELPWRASRDPYQIWVAEIMLQQTRIATVLPYYERFLKALPDLESLANANEDGVLRLWSGLGYYSRARNLRRAARQVVDQHGGQFPRDYGKALALAGIGHYTAAAVLSIAYDEPFAVLDGNVARVLARLTAMRGDLREPRRWKQLGALSTELLAKSAPGDWNQGLMELGEAICTPRAPRCHECPVARWCAARARGLTAQVPAPRRKPATVRMKIAAAILRDAQGRTLLVRDPGQHDEVLFSRMWQFPAVEVNGDAPGTLRAHLAASLHVDTSSVELEPLTPASHGVTFRSITLLPFLARVKKLPHLPRTRILALGDLHKLSISSATRKIAAALEKPAPAIKISAQAVSRLAAMNDPPQGRTVSGC